MSKNIGCTNCNRYNLIIDEQKSKLQLLETRLKDLIRAYKVITKERDQLQQAISSSSIGVDDDHVDQRQQKRISELEQSVCHMSTLCGELEYGRKQDQSRIKDLQEKYEILLDELNRTKSMIIQPRKQSTRSIELRDDYCQTDVLTSLQSEKSTQTELICDHIDSSEPNSKQLDQHQNVNKNKNETAIVAPLMRNNSKTVSESSDCSSVAVSSITPADTEFDSKISSEPFGSTSLYHLNELARKELELADYRLRIREYECSLRELQWKYSNDRYKYQARIADLEKLNKDLMATNDNNHQLKNYSDGHNNNINVAYVKNVLNKLLKTSDKIQQKLMTDALITALDSMQTSTKK
ncbi:hypothetical protein BLA29_005624 [Euroglyphus maynei]|uniref:Uncharacterized protein n=1 Tax=Euroglyphus maynei TaxID=6958 RepID=A0A1Y3B1Q7_EURMA|nr:hypothetical protein BLA29_005624 [Euroglyphus maynei]